MIKMVSFIRLLPKDGTSGRVSSNLCKALDALCSKLSVCWEQLIEGPNAGDVVIDEGACLKPADLSKLTTVDMIKALEVLAASLKKDGAWLLAPGSSITGWDDDGYILKAEIDHHYEVVFASPNWLLTKSVREMKDIQKEEQ